MAKLFSIFALFLVSSFCRGYSQSTLIKGNIKDTVGKINLNYTVVYLKNVDNSKLVSYTRANEAGQFEFGNIVAGKYIMIVNYPGYVDWIDTVTILERATLNVTVFLITKAHLLEEVIVKQNVSPIKIKGDTTEYLVDSFHLRPGANVEDLLRVLPGLSVNSKGEITSDGKRVLNVLVDGEEFFGNDPTMATQNLNKSDVAKVQVFDKKSDKANITGIEDGIKQKTINLILKENAKKGYFGEVSGGVDFDKYYQGKATISYFTNTLKTGVLFIADRSGRDIDNGDFGSFQGKRNGISEIQQGSVMLNKKMGALGNSTSNNFTYNHLSINGKSYTGIKYILPDTTNYSNQYNTNKSNISTQSFNSQNVFKIDSLNSLNVNLKYMSTKGTSILLTDGNVLAGDNTTFINSSQQNNTSTIDNSNLKTEIYFKRLLNKEGSRFYTFGGGQSVAQNNTQTFLYNKSEFYNGGIISSNQIVDQMKNSFNTTTENQLLASYVTPINNLVSINLNYSFNSSNNEQNINTYENRNGKYDSINLFYSNHFKFLNIFHQAGTTINLEGNKIYTKFGLIFESDILKQTNLVSDSVNTRTFINIFPSVGIKWKYSKFGNINFNYLGKTGQPTVFQLQPIKNNDDPNNIQIGNPDLRPSFKHSLSFDFSNYRQVTGRFIRGGAGLTVIQNDFSNQSTIDNQGKRTFQIINIDGNYSYNGWLTFQRDVKRFKINVGLSPEISHNHFINYINNIRNFTDITTYYNIFRINKPYSSNFPLDIQFQYSYDLNRSISSINSGLPSQYNIQEFHLFLQFGPKRGWQVSSFYNYYIREKLTANDPNTNAMILNASVEKLISSKNNISIILKASDIFNQNIGFNRTISSTSITENTYTTFQRYILFCLKWKFNKNRNPAN